MQSDYISRQAAIDALGMAIDVDDFRTATGLIHEATVSKVLDCIPAADVTPVVHGRWKKKKDSDLFYCSECGLPSMHKWPYCERCGAKMDGERKELEDE